MLLFIKKIIAGIAVGIANIIPGISGGTIALVFGVYSELMEAASLDIKKIKSSIKDYVCLFGGMAVGVLLFARLFKIIYQKFPIQTNFFFVGLILGSAFIIFEFVREKKDKTKIKIVLKFFTFLLGLSIMLALYLFKGTAANEIGLVIENLTFSTFMFLFFAGFAGAAAMVIPGVSGSFILLIMGAYYPIIKAITDFNIPVLLTVGLGVIAGIILSSRLIVFLIHKFPKITYAFLLGLVLGSILHILPQVCQPFLMRLASAICMMAGYTLIKLFANINKVEY